MTWHALLKSTKLLLAAFVLTLYANAASAWDRIALVVSEDRNAYVEFTSVLTASLADAGKRISVETIALSKFTYQERSNQLIIAVGEPAMHALAQKQTGSPVLNTFVSRASFLKASKINSKTSDPRWFSAVFIDQPWGRQLRLISNVLGGRPRVGVLLSPGSADLGPSLAAAAKEADISVAIENINDSAELLPTLKLLLSNTDAILAIPDSAIYNGTSLRTILLTISHRNKSLFGINKSYVNAGAVSAVHSTSKLLAQQVAELTDGQSSLPAPQYARYFTVSVNRTVAGSLGLFLNDESILVSKLKQTERNQ